MKIIPLKIKNDVKLQMVEAVCPTSPLTPIIACDFYIYKAEDWKEVPGGYQKGRVLNIDHHADVPRMEHNITSTNLAIDRIRQCGPPDAESIVVINHTDCDSILSAAIMSCKIQPDEIFGKAAIAADHTGEENSTADMLQGIKEHDDIEMSLRNLNLLLHGHPLEYKAQQGLVDRRRKRVEASHLLISFSSIDGIYYATLDEDTDSEFFPALLPDAVLILLSVPSTNSGKSIIKLRVGLAAPEGFSIHSLKINSFDHGFDHGYGGRWNAGSNKRSGGTSKHIEKYVEELSIKLKSCLTSKHPTGILGSVPIT